MDVVALVDEAHRRYRDVEAGSVSDVYPALARASPALYGVCVAAVDGRIHLVGDADVGFTIMSVAKPFTFALVCDALGPDEIQRRVGVNATGLPFNSLEAVERAEQGRTNPMVNPGAIATVSHLSGDSADERWDGLCAGLSLFAGRALGSTRRYSRRHPRRTTGTAPSRRRSGSAALSAATRSTRSTSTRGRAA